MQKPSLCYGVIMPTAATAAAAADDGNGDDDDDDDDGDDDDDARNDDDDKGEQTVIDCRIDQNKISSIVQEFGGDESQNYT